jgi:D-amino-acid dehydrogenase
LKKEVIVIGGGIIGLCSAYYLAKEGISVTVIDKSDMSDSGCSYGNAGMIVPSHVIPLAQPGVIQKGMKWMFDSKSPFYIKPRFDSNLIYWLYQFYKNCNQKHVDASIQPLLNISLLSKDLYRDLAKNSNSFFYDEKGLLMLFQSDKVGEEEVKLGNIAKSNGLEVDFLNQNELKKIENNIKIDALGAVHYKSDAHLSPNLFMQFLKSELERLHVEVLKNTTVIDFSISKGKIQEIKTNNGIFKAEEVIISSGAWSGKLARKLGINLTILPGKGYSFTLKNVQEKPQIPSILCEGKVAVTPFNNSIRFGGTMEITSIRDFKINVKRLEGIVERINQFYPTMKVSKPEIQDVWFGFRPCSPNGLPIIEKSIKIKNLIFATGHAMMGVSLAPATGKLVSELVLGNKTSIDITAFAKG